MVILGAASRRSGAFDAAIACLRALLVSQPGWWTAQFQLGLTLAAAGRARPALAAFSRAAACAPDETDCWRALGDQYRLLGREDEAAACQERQLRAAIRHPDLIAAADQLHDNRLALAERGLKDYLKRFPTDFVALRMLAEVAARLGRYEDAEHLLERCLELAPYFRPAQQNYAFVLQRQNKPVEALAALARPLADEPDDPNLRVIKAAALVQIGNYAEAIDLYDGVLRQYPDQPKLWMSYGHALKTENRREPAIAAYRRSIAQLPSLGEAYWSLANLKTFRFEEDEVAAMRSRLADDKLLDEDRLHFHFALGKALEDRGEHEESFRHYQQGNALRRRQIGYDADEATRKIDQTIALFDPRFLARRRGAGAQNCDPIFIVGLPRSGSTLIEQILASHSAVEGTMELPDLHAIAKDLNGARRIGEPGRYPGALAELETPQFRAIGEEYLRRTRIQRKSARPFFIDKMPNNFLHAGLIHLILPNARIIDARRHPMAACFSAYKQHFARGQSFSYGLADVGRYYADYARLMAHFDAVLPGRIHRVHYEAMVTDTDSEIRRLLDYCGLEFEPGCLAFWQNRRSVRTASSEQVRQPIFTDGLDHWRRYQPWLGELGMALGEAVDRYPYKT
jgi:tetratricopeptide (TPR) repeat protein